MQHSKFNKLVNEVLSGDVLGGTGEYNPGDNRPIEPSQIVLGAKKKKKKKGITYIRRNMH